MSPERDTVFGWLARALLAHRLLACIALLLAFAGCAAGCFLVRMDFSATAFFGSNTAALAELEDFLATWGRDDNLMLVVIEADSAHLCDAGRLTHVAQLAAALDSLEAVRGVRGVAELPSFRGPAAGTLLETLPHVASDSGCAAWREALQQTPWVPGLISADARVTALVLELAGNMDNQQVVDAVRAVDHLILSRQGLAGLRMQTAGVPAVRSAIFDHMLADQQLFVPLAALLMGAILLATYRRLHGVLIPLCVAAVPVVMLAGLMGYLGEPIGILNQIYFTLLPAIAIADSIHLVSRYQEEMRRPGPATRARQRQAIIAALQHVGAACALTSLTTIMGFLSLNLASIALLRSFGNFAALGMTLAYATTVLIAPLLLSFTRPHAPRPKQADGEGLIDRALLACAGLSRKQPRALLLGSLLLLLLGVLGGLQVEINNDLVGNLQPGHPISRANALADSKLGGILSLEIDLLGAPGCFDDPALMQRLAAFEAGVRTDSLVRDVLSPASMVADLRQLLSGQRALPQEPPALRLHTTMLEAQGVLRRVLDGERGRARVSIRISDRGALRFEEFEDRLEMQLDGLLAGRLDAIRLTGTAHNAYRGINMLTLDLRNSLLLVFGCIGLVILLLFRNLRVTLLCFLPNALPLVVGYGFLGAMGWALKPVTAVMFSVGLAIAVDDTIHLMARIKEELRSGGDTAHAVRNALLHSGRAVIVTSVILVSGLSLTLLSSFPAIVALSGLGMCVISGALLADLFVLPASLILFPIHAASGTPQPDPAASGVQS